MEERIAAQVKDASRGEIEELILDNVRESKLVGLSSEFTALKTLSAINMGLTSLEGLPALPSLQKLELGDNKLTGGLEGLERCPNLRHISLAGNRLGQVEDLQPLQSLSHLSTLDLLDCPLTKLEGYREKVFSLLPGLTSLDGIDQKGQEVEESDSEGEEEDGEGESEGEEEEAEEEEEEEDDDVGLDYLTKELGSDSSSEGGDYVPGEEEEGEDDHVLSEEEEEVGEPAPKKAKVDDAEEKKVE